MAPRPCNSKLRMNCKDKPMPIASLPDNWSVFNGHEVLPWVISRADAAAALRRLRGLRARGQATVSIEAVGRYRLVWSQLRFVFRMRLLKVDRR